jgi:hypothetical protein
MRLYSRYRALNVDLLDSWLLHAFDLHHQLKIRTHGTHTKSPTATWI